MAPPEGRVSSAAVALKKINVDDVRFAAIDVCAQTL
jgi:hypothetical protein